MTPSPALSAVVVIGEIVMDAVVVLRYWCVLPLDKQEYLGRYTKSGIVAAAIVGVMSALVFFDAFGGHLLTVAWPPLYILIGLCALVASIGGFAYLGFSGYETAINEVKDESWKS